MEFKDILKKLREDRHISQYKLANDLEVTPGAIGMYETGRRKPSYEMLEAIADYFNVDIDYLTGRESVSTYVFKPEDAELLTVLSKQAKLKQLLESANNLTDEQIDKVLMFIDMIK